MFCDAEPAQELETCCTKAIDLVPSKHWACSHNSGTAAERLVKTRRLWFGLLGDGPKASHEENWRGLHIAQGINRHPELCRFLNQIAAALAPSSFAWTSIQVLAVPGSGDCLPPHHHPRDWLSNSGEICLGDFHGGALWVEDPRGNVKRGSLPWGLVG